MVMIMIVIVVIYLITVGLMSPVMMILVTIVWRGNGLDIRNGRGHDFVRIRVIDVAVGGIESVILMSQMEGIWLEELAIGLLTGSSTISQQIFGFSVLRGFPGG